MSKPGLYVAQCRQTKKLSQSQAATKIGVHTQSLSNWERSVSPIPPMHVHKLNRIGVDRGKLVKLMIENYGVELDRAVRKGARGK